MEFRIDNKAINLASRKEIPLIAKGKTGNIYRYGSEVLKVFDGEIKPQIDHDTAKTMTKIHTKRILLPKRLLMCGNTFSGYTLNRIPKKGTKKKMVTTPKDELVCSIRELEEDVEEISANNILLSDVSPENTIFNGKLYLSDPSKYTKLSLAPTEDLNRVNQYQIYLLLSELFAKELRTMNFSKSIISQFRELLSLKDNEQKPSEYLDYIIDDKSNIKEMIKVL